MQKKLALPTIDRLDGIKINVYNGDHRPPHIHALYNEFEVLIEIETFEIYRGHLPNKQLKKAMAWLKENADWILQIFYELNPELR